ncbi:MAG: hypothetical protein WDM70_00235 [Nitrosomonadales bacterium]
MFPLLSTETPNGLEKDEAVPTPFALPAFPDPAMGAGYTRRRDHADLMIISICHVNISGAIDCNAIRVIKCCNRARTICIPMLPDPASVLTTPVGVIIRIASLLLSAT